MSEPFNEDDLASVVQMAMEGLYDDQTNEVQNQNNNIDSNHNNDNVHQNDQSNHSLEEVDFEAELQRQIEEQFQNQMNGALENYPEDAVLQEEVSTELHPNSQTSQEQEQIHSNEDNLNETDQHDHDMFGEDDFAREVERQLQAQLDQAQDEHTAKLENAPQENATTKITPNDTSSKSDQAREQSQSQASLNTGPQETIEETSNSKDIPHSEIRQDTDQFVDDLQKEIAKQLQLSTDQQVSTNSEEIQPIATPSAHVEQTNDDYDQELQKQIMEALNGTSELEHVTEEHQHQAEINDDQEMAIDENDAFAQELQKQIMDAFNDQSAVEGSKPASDAQPASPQPIHQEDSAKHDTPSVQEQEDDFEKALQKQIMDAFAAASNVDLQAAQQPDSHQQPLQDEAVTTSELTQSSSSDVDQLNQKDGESDSFESVFEQELHNQIMEAFGKALGDQGDTPSQRSAPVHTHVPLAQPPKESQRSTKKKIASHSQLALQPPSQLQLGAHQQVPQTADESDFDLFQNPADVDYTLDDDDPYKDALAELVKSVVDSHIESHHQQLQAQGLPEDEDIDMNQIMQNALAMAVEDPTSLLQSLNLPQNDFDSSALLGQLLQHQVDHDQTNARGKKKSVKDKKPREKKPKAPKKTAAIKKKEVGIQGALSQVSSQHQSSLPQLQSPGVYPNQLQQVQSGTFAPRPFQPHAQQQITQQLVQQQQAQLLKEQQQQQVRRGPLPIIPNQNLPLRNTIPTHAKLLSRQITELQNANRLSTSQTPVKPVPDFSSAPIRPQVKIPLISPANSLGLNKSTAVTDSSLQSSSSGSTPVPQSQPSAAKKLSIAETLALSRSSMSSGKFSSQLQDGHAMGRPSQGQSSAGTEGVAKRTTASQPPKAFRPQIPLSQIKQMIKNVDTTGLYNFGRSKTSITGLNTAGKLPLGHIGPQPIGSTIDKDKNVVPQGKNSLTQPSALNGTGSQVNSLDGASVQGQQQGPSDSTATKSSTPEPHSHHISNNSTPSSTSLLPVAPGTQGNAIINNIGALLPNLPSNLTNLISTAISNALNNTFNHQKENVKVPKRKTVVIKDETPEEQRERVRIENRERKKRWRDANRLKNQNNDLRARLKKRAIQLFGPMPSEKREAWIEEEFLKRKTRRVIRSANLDDLTAIINETIQKLEVDSLDERTITKVVSDLVNNAMSSANQQALFKDHDDGTITPGRSNKDDDDLDTPSPSSRQNSNKNYQLSGSAELSRLHDDVTSREVGDLELGELLQQASSETRPVDKEVGSSAAKSPDLSNVTELAVVSGTSSTTTDSTGLKDSSIPRIGSPIKLTKPSISTSNIGTTTQQRVTGQVDTVSVSLAVLSGNKDSSPQTGSSVTSVNESSASNLPKVLPPLKRPADNFPRFNFKKMKIPLIPISKSKAAELTNKPAPEKSVIDPELFGIGSAKKDQPDITKDISVASSEPEKAVSVSTKEKESSNNSAGLKESIAVQEKPVVTAPAVPVTNVTPIVKEKEYELSELQRLKALATARKIQRPPIVITDKKTTTEKGEEKTGDVSKPPKESTTRDSSPTSKSPTVKDTQDAPPTNTSNSSSSIFTKPKPVLTRPKFGGAIKKPGAFQGLRKPGAFARPIDREKKRVNV